MTVNIPALVEALQINSIAEIAYKEPDSFFIGYYHFYLDENFLKNDSKKWKLDDIRSVLNILSYLDLIPRDHLYFLSVIYHYKKLTL